MLSVMTPPPPQLKEGVRYVVSLTIAKGDRSATASRIIIPSCSPKSLSACFWNPLHHPHPSLSALDTPTLLPTTVEGRCAVRCVPHNRQGRPFSNSKPQHHAIRLTQVLQTVLSVMPPPPLQLKEGVRYVVSLTIAKGDRSTTASRSIIASGSPKSLSAEVRRSCGVDVATGAHLPCPSAHNPTDPLTLIAVPGAPFDFDVSGEIIHSFCGDQSLGIRD